jgi:hypothetical protein
MVCNIARLSQVGRRGVISSVTGFLSDVAMRRGEGGGGIGTLRSDRSNRIYHFNIVWPSGLKDMYPDVNQDLLSAYTCVFK